MIARGGPDHCGTVGGSSPKVVLSILWMRTRRRAAVSSFGSGWSWELTSMMKAEVTAENRPACDSGQPVCIQVARGTHEYQRHVQILATSLIKPSVILLGHLAVILVESEANILRSRPHALPLTVGEVSATFRRDAKWHLTSLPVSRCPPRPPPCSAFPQDSYCSPVLANRDVTGEIRNRTLMCRPRGCSDRWYSGASWIWGPNYHCGLFRRFHIFDYGANASQTPGTVEPQGSHLSIMISSRPAMLWNAAVAHCRTSVGDRGRKGGERGRVQKSLMDI